MQLSFVTMDYMAVGNMWTYHLGTNSVHKSEEMFSGVSSQPKALSFSFLPWAPISLLVLV